MTTSKKPVWASEPEPEIVQQFGVFIRNAYNYNLDKASLDSGLSCPEPTMAVQDSAADCDINTIVRRFGITGEMPTGVRLPTYGDFTGVSDYQTALTIINESLEAFMAFPADFRARFENDPQQFLEFVENDANRAEAEKLGLVLPKADISVEIPVVSSPST